MKSNNKLVRKAGRVMYILSAAFLIAAMLVNVIPPTTAYAHHPQLSGVVTCAVDGRQKVTWTINNWSGTTLPMKITAINRSVGVPINTMVPVSVQGVEYLPGNQTGTVTLKVSGAWTNGATGKTSVTKTLPGACVPPAKVNVCHATGSSSNPYVLINVSTNSVASSADFFAKGHGSHVGDSWDGFYAKNLDFIPAFGNMANCTQPPVDVCNNIVGNQADIPEGYISDGDGGCVLPPVDVCNNIEGNQADMPEGYISDGDGGCVLPPVDVCNNIEGNQADIPEGYISDGDGGCVLPPVDVCNNIEGNQADMPEGYISDGDGGCVLPPVDVCNNIEGNQADMPEGYISDGDGGCVLPPVDVCNNIEGNQADMPEGYISDGDGGCVLPPVDVCNNIEGNQADMPEGYISDGDGGCVLPPVDVCNNIEGNQADMPEGYISDGDGGCVLPPVDVCNNIEGNQADIPEGYISDGDGGCVLPPVDVCNNIEGNQADIPEGYISDGDGGCVLPPVDVCNNIEGNQADMPEGYISDGDGGCVLPPVDVCNNIEGNQADLPEGYISDGDGGCVLPSTSYTICWQGTPYNNLTEADLVNYPGYWEGKCPVPFVDPVDYDRVCTAFTFDNLNPIKINGNWSIDGTDLSGFFSLAPFESITINTGFHAGDLKINSGDFAFSIPVPTNCDSSSVLIPVTGVETGSFGKFGSQNLFFASIAFLGLGLVLSGIGRKLEE